ncbi:hypothetical protein AB4289_20850 [Vibrio cyclitrophicus]
MTSVDIILLTTSLLVLVIPYVLVQMSLLKSKSHHVILLFSIILIILSTVLTYRFLSIQEKASDIRAGQINSVVTINNEIKKIDLEIELRKGEDLPVDILLAQKENFETDISLLEKKLEQTRGLQYHFHILNVLVAILGFSVAANFIAKIASENEITCNKYEVPNKLYRRIEDVESKISTLSFLVFLVLILQLVLLVKS